MRRDDLLEYYERELRFIRRMAADFAEKYPEVAGRLLLEPTKCDDPHIERLIESFAMLTVSFPVSLNTRMPHQSRDGSQRSTPGVTRSVRRCCCLRCRNSSRTMCSPSII